MIYIENYYYKFLERICLLKTKSDFNEDLGLGNINKGAGLIIDYFYIFRRYFKNFSLFLNSYNNFQHFKELSEKYIKKCENNEGNCIIFYNNIDENFFKNIEFFFDDFCYFLEKKKKNFSDFEINFYKKMINVKENFKNFVEKIRTKKKIFLKSEIEKIIEFLEASIQGNLTSICEKLVENFDNLSSFYYYELLQKKKKEIGDKINEIKKFLQEKKNKNNEFKENIQEKIEKMQIFIQKLKKYEEIYKNNMSGENSDGKNLTFFINEENHLKKIRKILVKIQENVKNYNEKIFAENSFEYLKNIPQFLTLQKIILTVRKLI